MLAFGSCLLQLVNAPGMYRALVPNYSLKRTAAEWLR